MISDFISLFFYYFFKFLTKVLPKKLMDFKIWVLSILIYHIYRKYNKIINTNLTLTFPNLTKKEKNKIGRESIYNLLQVIIGFMRRSNISKEEFLKDIEVKNEDILKNALKENKKIILFTAHYSNWEVLPLVVTTYFNTPFSVIGRKLNSKAMDKILFKQREKFNIEMIYRKGAMKNSLKRLKENRPIGFLIDQHLGAKQGGIEVDFFGKRVFQSPAISILARQLDALIIPVFIETKDYKKHTITIYNPLETIKTQNKQEDIFKMTQEQSNFIEKIVKKEPAPWLWSHKKFKGFYLYE